jgi:hypothetical protein
MHYNEKLIRKKNHNATYPQNWKKNFLFQLKGNLFLFFSLIFFYYFKICLSFTYTIEILVVFFI